MSEIGFQTGAARVYVSQPGTPQALADAAQRCVDKIVYVGDQAPDHIRQQARAFRGRVYSVVHASLQEVQNNERRAIIEILQRNGMLEAADMVRKL